MLQATKMKLFVKTFDVSPLTIFAKSSILDVSSIVNAPLNFDEGLKLLTNAHRYKSFHKFEGDTPNYHLIADVSYFHFKNYMLYNTVCRWKGTFMQINFYKITV